MAGSRWLLVYYDGTRDKAKILVDGTGLKLPFGVGNDTGKIEPGEIDISVLVELPEGFEPRIVLGGEMLEEFEEVKL